MCKFIQSQVPPTIIYCDNKGVIHKINHPIEITPRTKEQDLLQYIKKIIPTKYEAHHVKVHRNKETFNISVTEHLNCIANYITGHQTTVPKKIHPPDQVAIYYKYQYIPYNLDRILRKHHHELDAEKSCVQNIIGQNKHTII